MFYFNMFLALSFRPDSFKRLKKRFTSEYFYPDFRNLSGLMEINNLMFLERINIEVNYVKPH